MKSKIYGTLCSLFYDATKKYAPEKEVAFYASFMKKDDRILEAMCGSGRLLIPLFQRGFIVDGVDNSPIMLDRCRKRCKEFKINPELYEQSLEDFKLHRAYHSVTIAVGSFQLIVDRQAALKSLKNIRAHMRPGGSLLIDIFVPDVTQETRSVRIALIDQHSVIRLTTRYNYNQQEKRADAFCFYELLVDGAVQQQENELMQVTWYTDDEFGQLLEEAGFHMVKIYEETFGSSGPSRIVYASPE